MNSDERESEGTRQFAVCVLEFMRDQYGGPFFDEFLTALGPPLSSRQASVVVADLVEWTQYIAGDELSALNECLANNGLPTLTLMRRRQDRKLGALISSGEITSDDDYRLLEARLSDMGDPLPESDRAIANRMLLQYEAKRTV
jgi:hypothetical protein